MALTSLGIVYKFDTVVISNGKGPKAHPDMVSNSLRIVDILLILMH